MSETTNIPRVVVIGLASCFGCQINITNIESHLMEVLGQIDVRYWQLTSSDTMPDEFDVAVIEGAATTKEALETLASVRERAKVVITIGACAATAGIPGMAAPEWQDRINDVYGDNTPAIVSDIACKPQAVHDVIKVDYEVPCCPIDPYAFVHVLQKALYGSNEYSRTSTMCGECKRNERGCFYGRGILCMGMITKQGCGARCPNLGRPCNGCAGLSPDANLDAARVVVQHSGVPLKRFNDALAMFNQDDPRIAL
ncbi:MULTISPECIES: NADH:ubiquinone oxidoreductase [unclassified Adlercreutzia]|uniref:NADH-quinone oxidoreductase subunit B family protein n=1 Tax=unclassified Adlercreutzia TaxID=2636013 RepID=UPI001F14C1F3|nr:MULTISPECIES: NADH:ubiquinone oxidoreductase [unclassified Adlercreutzia]